MLLAVLTFVAGVYVGYKYPAQVEQAIEFIKKLFNDVKNMFSKKENPPQA